MSPLSSHWPRALALLDEAMRLTDAQREPWLAALAANEPHVLPLLHKLMEAHGRVQAHELLATLPKLQSARRPGDAGAIGQVIGPFELVAPLGRGGMGSVWRARYADGRLKRDVAVKLPTISTDPDTLGHLRERFARERDFLAQLQHPHIARLYDAGISADGQPFLAMEYVPGQPIDVSCDILHLGLDARLTLFQQVLDAVAYAHQQLVLHRDLKPGNVLVDAQGQVRLLDFGIARLLPPPAADADPPPSPDSLPALNLTEQAGAAYTLGHAAPEQISRGALSTATDVYALGVMLYQLLTGLSPYQPTRDTRGALEDAVLLATPALASSRQFDAAALAARQSTAQALRQVLRGDLDTILAKALKKDPAERYATVGALQDDLRRHAASLPISARPDTWAYRSRLFVARHRLAVLVTALASAALLGTAGVAAWQARVSAANAAIASKEAARANAAQQFFARLLSNADPEKNKHITAVDRQVADQALASAERDFADAPETLALVLKQLGEIYDRLGVPERQLEAQRKRVAVLARLPDAKPDELLDAQTELAWELGRHADPAVRAQSIPTLQAAYDRAVAGRLDNSLLVKLMCAMADQHVAERKHAQAAQWAQRAEEHALRHLPKLHPMRALAHEARGITAGRLGQFDVARQAFQQSIAVDATGQARGVVDQVRARGALATLEYEAGQYTESARTARDALAMARAQLGATDGSLTSLRMRAVFATERSGDAEGAARLWQELMADDLASGDGFRAGRARFMQGWVAVARGALDEAERAFSTAEPGLAVNPNWRRYLASELAGLKLRRGRPAEALALLQPMLAQLRSQTGTDGNEFGSLAERAGVALARLGRLAEARQLFNDACRWRQATYAPNHPVRVRCEAYRVLADEATPRPDRQQAMTKLAGLLTAGRDDHMALVASLRLASASLAGRGPAADVPTDFLFLD